MAADGPIGSALADRVEGAWEPVLAPHSGDRGQSPRGGDDDYGPQWDDGSGSGTAVCNTVVKRPLPALPVGSEGFTVGALPVQLHRLRAALDWATVLVQRPVEPAVWQHLQAVSEGTIRVVLLSVADSPPLPLDLSIDPQRPSQMVLRGCGVFLRVMRPAAADVSHAGATYPVEIQVQGEWLATSRSGGHSLVRSVVAAVGRLFWPSLCGSADAGRFTLAPLPVPVDDGDVLPGCEDLAVLAGRQVEPMVAGGRFTDDQVLALLDGETRIGRVDVAVDVAVSGEARDQWLTEAIFANGSHVEATARFSTRARRKESRAPGREPEPEPEPEPTAPARMLGSANRGRTIYIGRSLIELCVYEKDRAPAKRSTTLALETLQQAGWDAEKHRVIRWEARVSRAWWRDQRFEIAGKTQMGDTLTLSQWEKVMPDIAVKLGERIRHTDHIDAATRVKRRESSAWQLEIEAALAKWEDRPGDPSRVVAIRRTQTVDRAEKAILLSAARLSGVGGKPISDILAYMSKRWSALPASTLQEDAKLLRKLEEEAEKYATKYPAPLVEANAA